MQGFLIPISPVIFKHYTLWTIPINIYKYVHSCLLIEQDHQKLLFDPGTFTFQQNTIASDTFADVQVVVVTHNHPDHLDVEAHKAIVSPSGATGVTNRAVAHRLSKAGIKATVLEEGERQIGAFLLRAFNTPHQAILDDTLPQNTAYIVNNRLLNPGDSFAAPLLAYKETPILVLPVAAPWANEIEVRDFGVAMQPRDIIPVHDGQNKDFFCKNALRDVHRAIWETGHSFPRAVAPRRPYCALTSWHSTSTPGRTTQTSRVNPKLRPSEFFPLPLPFAVFLTAKGRGKGKGAAKKLYVV